MITRDRVSYLPFVELFLPVDAGASEPYMVVLVGTFETSVLVLCGVVLALVVGIIKVDVSVITIGVTKNIELCKVTNFSYIKNTINYCSISTFSIPICI